jgi:hypothetical protein
MTASTFTCEGLSLPGDRDPLGVWALQVPRSRGGSPLPVPPPEGKGAWSRGEKHGALLEGKGVWSGVETYGAPQTPEGLVWTVTHPAGAESRRAWREARSLLSAQLAAVERRDQALDAIESRLSGLSPMPAYRADMGSHEALLLAQVTALQALPTSYASAHAMTPVPSEGFPTTGVPGLIPRTLSRRQLVQQAERIEDAGKLLVELRRLVHHWAWVETQVGQRRIALTTVDWMGDYQTTWLDGLTAHEMDLHLDAVRLALASRHALLRLVVVAVTGALELALKAAVPGGQILLIPAVYRYVRDLLAELDGVSVEGLPSWQAEPAVG